MQLTFLQFKELSDPDKHEIYDQYGEDAHSYGVFNISVLYGNDALNWSFLAQEPYYSFVLGLLPWLELKIAIEKKIFANEIQGIFENLNLYLTAELEANKFEFLLIKF
jgi:hypothetical protein